MRPTIKINPKTGITYIPGGVRKEGFVGEVESFPNAITLTLVRPGSTLDDVEESLENVLRDIRIRKKYQKVENANKEPV